MNIFQLFLKHWIFFSTTLNKVLLLLELLLAGTPLVLQGLVEREAVDVLGPPLSPAGEEDALRVSG